MGIINILKGCSLIIFVIFSQNVSFAGFGFSPIKFELGISLDSVCSAALSKNQNSFFMKEFHKKTDSTPFFSLNGPRFITAPVKFFIKRKLSNYEMSRVLTMTPGYNGFPGHYTLTLAPGNSDSKVLVNRSRKECLDEETLEIIETVYKEITAFKNKFRLPGRVVDFNKNLDPPLFVESQGSFEAEFLEGSWDDYENGNEIRLRLTATAVEAWKKDELEYLQPVIDKILAAIDQTTGKNVKLGKLRLEEFEAPKVEIFGTKDSLNLLVPQERIKFRIDALLVL